MSDETLWKERAEHYCKVVENLVQQVSVAARLGDTFDLFKTQVKDRLFELDNVVKRIGCVLVSLEATAKRFENPGHAIQGTGSGTMHQVDMKPMCPLPTPTGSWDEDEDEDEDEDVVEWETDVRDAALATELQRTFSLDEEEMGSYFKFGKRCTLHLKFSLSGADIVVSGKIIERPSS